jgi:hypothetical protein
MCNLIGVLRYVDIGNRMDDEPTKGFWGRFNPTAVGFRWGGGVVSNTTFAAIVAFLTMPFIAWALSREPLIALAACGMVALVVLILFFGTWFFAPRHPELAMLSGPEYYRLKQAEMGTMDNPKIMDATNVEAPNQIEGPKPSNGP